MSALGDNVRKHRRQAGLSQLELAGAADLSPSTVAKVEQGGSCSMETLHTIARALDVKTSQLLAEDPPERERCNRPERLNLRDLRIALTPPIALSAPTGSRELPRDEPDMYRLRREARDAALLYPAGRYESLAATLPGLVRAADAAVAYFTDGEERRQALLARAEVLGLVGRYLNQVRQFDMAHTVVRGAIADAQEADDVVAVAARVRGLCFVLLRTGRFDEAEAMAVEAMDLVEPRITGADPDRYAVWGGVAMEAAAAAIRNNRPQEAGEYRRAASVAATAIGHQHQYGLPGSDCFGPVTAAMKSLEDPMIVGDAQAVVRRAEEEEALTSRAWKRLGTPGKNDRNRFALDVARAHVRTGDSARAEEELVRLCRVAPNWLDQQNMAAYTWEEVAAKRKRTLTPEMREVGRHLGVIG
ncbi:helix-turn-helix domain-containing protein [Streptomyces sp. NPDC005474]|uniref:helix-turn-helix domain-containing protein n=1 Tax=Streptomyces sp. NPDC005474 TaxID=3154878 RepID=UPI003456EE7D